MLQRVLLACVVGLGAAACSSEPDWIVLAAPQTGDQYQLGESLFHRFAEGLGEHDDWVLKAGDSACNGESAENLARQITQAETTTRLVIGPLCYSAYSSAQSILQPSGIPQLPLIPGQDWNLLLDAEADIIARFTTQKMQSKNTLIAYVANEYGNTMAEKLRDKLGDNASLFPLSNLRQTTRNEAVDIVNTAPSVLIVASEYAKAKTLVENIVSRGSNSVLVMTGAAQPAQIINEIGPKRLDTTRFPTAATSIEEVADPLGGLVADTLDTLAMLLEDDEISQEEIEQLPQEIKLRMVRVERDGTLAFDAGL